MYACNIHPHSSHINDCEPFPIRKILLATNDPDHLQKNNCCTFHSFCKRPAHPDGMDYLQTQLLYLPSFFSRGLPCPSWWHGSCAKKKQLLYLPFFFQEASPSWWHQLFAKRCKHVLWTSIIFKHNNCTLHPFCKWPAHPNDMIICKHNCCTAPSSLTSHLDDLDHLQIDEDFRHQVLQSFSQWIWIAAAGGLCRDPVRAAEGGHEHDLGGQCGQEEEEEGHRVEEHLEGEEEGHPQSSWTSGIAFGDLLFSFWYENIILPSLPAMDGSTWRHWMCWTTTTMWTLKSWLRASLTCSTMSFPNQSRKFLKLVGSGLQQEVPNCVHHQRWWSVASMLVGLDLEICQEPAEGQERCQSQCLVNEECQYRELCCKWVLRCSLLWQSRAG